MSTVGSSLKISIAMLPCPVATVSSSNGTGVKTPGEHIFPYIQKNVDEIITVEDQELIVSFLDMVENHKMVVENSGLLSVAALKHIDCQGKKIVSILSGGNMDVITMSSMYAAHVRTNWRHWSKN